MKLPRFGTWHQRWLQRGQAITLHRAYVIDWADDDEIWGHGVSACGMLDQWHMPGFMSRIGAPRCPKCCDIAGVPRGDGAPFNQGIDA